MIIRAIGRYSVASPPPRRRGDGVFRGKASDSRATAYAREALDREVDSVSGAISGAAGGHGRNNTLNEAAFAMGQLVGAGAISEQEVISRLSAAARRCGLHEDDGGEAGIDATIRSGLEAGKLLPRVFPWMKEERQSSGVDKPVTDAPRWHVVLDGEIVADDEPEGVIQLCADDRDEESESNIRTFELCTIGYILRTDYPEPKWVINGLMSEGLNILAGAPKQGKSLWALNIALTVAGGGLALGDTKVDVADVLYLSLEDQQRRIKSRAVKMLKKIEPTLSSSVADRLTITTDWPRQDAGGLQMIDLWTRRATNPGLLIIDVWNRFSPVYRQSGSTYNQDADFMSEVKKFVERRGFSALIVHHTRKPGMKEPEDFVNEVSGTLGLSGTADGILVLMRSRQDKQAALHVTGRDVPEQELVLEFDDETLTWRSLGTKLNHVEGRVQQKVVQYLRGNRPTAFFISDIAMSVEEKADSVKHACSNLLKNKIIRKSGNAFSYPGEAIPDKDRDEGDVLD